MNAALGSRLKTFFIVKSSNLGSYQSNDPGYVSINILGGYTEASWSAYVKDPSTNMCNRATDSNSFLFSLVNQATPPYNVSYKFPIKSGGANTICNTANGFMFGWTDFFLQNNCDQTKICMQTGDTTNYAYNFSSFTGPNQLWTLLGGAETFFTAEIEIYQVTSQTFDSKILPTRDQQLQLFNLIGFASTSSLGILHRATRDGFGFK